jgi:hypothetical protein
MWRSPVSVHAWGAWGRRFESSHSDKFKIRTMGKARKQLKKQKSHSSNLKYKKRMEKNLEVLNKFKEEKIR